MAFDTPVSELQFARPMPTELRPSPSCPWTMIERSNFLCSILDWKIPVSLSALPARHSQNEISMLSQFQALRPESIFSPYKPKIDNHNLVPHQSKIHKVTHIINHGPQFAMLIPRGTHNSIATRTTKFEFAIESLLQFRQKKNHEGKNRALNFAKQMKNSTLKNRADFEILKKKIINKSSEFCNARKKSKVQKPYCTMVEPISFLIMDHYGS